jgi:hypothetical protein
MSLKTRVQIFLGFSVLVVAGCGKEKPSSSQGIVPVEARQIRSENPVARPAAPPELVFPQAAPPRTAESPSQSTVPPPPPPAPPVNLQSPDPNSRQGT